MSNDDIVTDPPDPRKLKRRDTIYEDILGNMVRETEEGIKNAFKLNMVLEADEYAPIKRNKIPYQLFKKYLNKVINEVHFTNGHNEINKDVTYCQFLNKPTQVSCIGVDKNNLDCGENVILDIESESTKLPFFCKMMIVNQGKINERSPAVLVREVCLQIGESIIEKIKNSSRLDTPRTDDLNKSNTTPRSSRTRHSSWSLMEEYYSIPHFQYKGKAKINFNKGVNTHVSMGISADEFNEMHHSFNSSTNNQASDTNDLADYLKKNSDKTNSKNDENTLTKICNNYPKTNLRDSETNTGHIELSQPSKFVNLNDNDESVRNNFTSTDDLLNYSNDSKAKSKYHDHSAPKKNEDEKVKFKKPSNDSIYDIDGKNIKNGTTNTPNVLLNNFKTYSHENLGRQLRQDYLTRTTGKRPMQFDGDYKNDSARNNNNQINNHSNIYDFINETNTIFKRCGTLLDDIHHDSKINKPDNYSNSYTIQDNKIRDSKPNTFPSSIMKDPRREYQKENFINSSTLPLYAKDINQNRKTDIDDNFTNSKDSFESGTKQDENTLEQLLRYVDRSKDEYNKLIHQQPVTAVKASRSKADSIGDALSISTIEPGDNTVIDVNQNISFEFDPESTPTNKIGNKRMQGKTMYPEYSRYPLISRAMNKFEKLNNIDDIIQQNGYSADNSNNNFYLKSSSFIIDKINENRNDRDKTMQRNISKSFNTNHQSTENLVPKQILKNIPHTENCAQCLKYYCNRENCVQCINFYLNKENTENHHKSTDQNTLKNRENSHKSIGLNTHIRDPDSYHRTNGLSSSLRNHENYHRKEGLSSSFADHENCHREETYCSLCSRGTDSICIYCRRILSNVDLEKRIADIIEADQQDKRELLNKFVLPVSPRLFGRVSSRSPSRRLVKPLRRSCSNNVSFQNKRLPEPELRRSDSTVRFSTADTDPYFRLRHDRTLKLYKEPIPIDIVRRNLCDCSVVAAEAALSLSEREYILNRLNGLILNADTTL